jgi:membrane protein DedA with SNARE-associated domain
VTIRLRGNAPALLIGGALLVGIALLTLGGALAEGAAYLLPAAALVAVLLLGGYPGESALFSIARRVASRARRAPRLRAPCPRAAQLLLPRGSRLLGSALAVRPPPPAA